MYGVAPTTNNYYQTLQVNEQYVCNIQANKKETATVIQRKKPGQRLLFEPEGGRTEDHNSVFQRELSKVIDLNITKTSEACSRTS